MIGLSIIGEMLRRDNHSLKMKLAKLCKGGPELQYEKHGVVGRTSLPKSWLEVTLVIMQVVMLDTINLCVRIFHFIFLNHLKGIKMNIIFLICRAG